MPSFNVVPTKDLTFQPRNSKSKYSELLEAANDLKPGESIPLDLPQHFREKLGNAKGLETFRNRIAAVIHRSARSTTGRLTVRTLEETGVAVCCLSPKEAKTAAPLVEAPKRSRRKKPRPTKVARRVSGKKKATRKK